MCIQFLAKAHGMILQNQDFPFFSCRSMRACRSDRAVRTSTQFTDIEVGELLNIIRAKKPIGNEMWKEVENEWNALAASRSCPLSPFSKSLRDFAI